MVEVACAVCGERFYRYRSHAQRAVLPTCSRECNGVLRGRDWAQHAHKGRAAWSPASEAAWRERMAGARNPAWKGGVTLKRAHGNYSGVRYVRCPEPFLGMARKDGYVMEHRLIVARHLGRLLARAEVVHHVSRDPSDNRLENLMLFANNGAHKRFERHGTPAPLWRGSSPSTTAASSGASASPPARS